MSDKTHNGYTNYETWIMAAMIDNECESQERWRATAKDVWFASRDKTPNQFMDRSSNARHQLMERLKDYFDDHAEHPVFAVAEGSVYADLLNSALSEVNWYELADDFLSSLLEDGKIRGFVTYQTQSATA